MSHSISSALVICIVLLCLPNKQLGLMTVHHPILKLFVDDPPEIDINLLYKYGLVHTIQDYIHWNMLEEHFYPTFSEKLNWLVQERTLIKVYLQGRVKRANSNNFIQPHHSSLLKHEMVLIQLGSHLLKHPYKVIRGTIAEILEIDDGNNLIGLWIELPEMFMSIHSLLMIQKTYLWLPHKIGQDLKVNITSEVVLTQKQTTEIGMCSLFRNMHTSALEWLEFSLKLFKEETTKVSSYLEIDKSVTLDLVKMVIALAIQKHNKAGHLKECYKNFRCFMTLYTRPIFKNTTKRVPFKRRELSQEIKRLKAGILNSKDVDPPTQYINLCTSPNQTVQPSQILAKLKCFYERSRHPFLYINPVKMEQLSLSPQVYQFYDIIGPKLVDKLVANYKENASLGEILKNMHHYNRKILLENIESTPAYLIRTTKNYNGHRIFYRLIEAVTGIKFEGASEELQFLGYTVGKGIDAHEDIIRDHPEGYFTDTDGNRVACILYYLEIPTLGGHTPFCQAGCRAHLERGSAVIWFNKFKNGTNRNDMFHGACPVLQGTKLILAQAIEYIGQWNHYKCSLNQLE